jgi:N-acetylglutamate synthase-like GNAT family acetyltransferase
MGTRTLRKEDLDFAVALTHEEGWYYTARELGVMLKMDPEGSFIYEEQEPLGFATCVTYGHTGVLGHLIVGKKGRGRKIGESLLRTSVENMTSKGAKSILLYATLEGTRLYQKFGFTIRDEISCRHLNIQSSHLNNSSSSCTPLKRSDLPEVVAIDSAMFGDDREKLIRLLFEEGANHAFKIEQDGRVAGYVLGRPNHVGYDLGPWACLTGNPRDAEGLFWTALSTFGEGTLYMGSFFNNAAALRIIDKLPLIKTWRIPLMIRGEARYTSNMDKLYGIAAFELG